ncbi:ww domain containing protein [Grosmannia clavigera kw1407]|uniref:Ww domain containing protein n=1 Tax=Grosmannia clavigera (strain kw1407 / UAMH 11150) TaxID=655863 RepID=F0XQ29_GROCL|nr:ww domain containing protein [Grosmannia clavigera kw1407]EFX00073.1 ww domain containing protein [Grosmannia clavigera kw1407]
MAPSLENRAVAMDEAHADQKPDDTNAIEESRTETKSQAEESQPCTSSSPPHEDAAAESEQSENGTEHKERGEVSEGEDEDENAKSKDGSAKATSDTDAEAAGEDAAAPPPLPDEPLPEVQEDDGWDPMWSEEHKSWFFFNRFTKQTQWENPRVPTADEAAAAAAATVAASGGYNPAIHGDYDPNAWYAKGLSAEADAKSDVVDGADEDAAIAAAAAAASAILNGGSVEDADGRGESQFSHDAKARRQMNAFFDMDAAASSHDGRSLKAERSGKKPTRAELKAFKEKRRVRKEEKRRAWLRD